MPDFTAINQLPDHFKEVAIINDDEKMSSSVIKDEHIEDPSPSNTPSKRGREKADQNGAEATTTPTKKAKKKPAAAAAVGGDGSSMNGNDTNGPGANDTDPSAENGAATSAASTPVKKTKLGPIPTSYEEAGVADRMILRMKDVEGKSYSEITTAYEALHGFKLDGSTLRKRYNSMKANFVVFAEEDEARLLKIKKDLEDKFEQEKWHKIAESMAADGGGQYPPSALSKKFKQLAKSTGGAAGEN